jgi:glycosyltransferase involved in cell wall biosynthesis
MKILQVNSVYPLWSTGKITHDIHTVLVQEGHQSIVCYGLGEKLLDPYTYKVASRVETKLNRIWARLTGVMYGGNWFATRRLIQIIKEEHPDIVHLQCINGYFINIYRLITFLKKNRIKTVLTLHAEFMYTANCGYAFDCERWKNGCGKCPQLRQEVRSLFFDSTALSWKKMYQAFYGFNEGLRVISVSPWLQNRALQSPILKDKQHEVILNGIDTSTFKYQINQSIYTELNIDTNAKIIFHATPNFTDDPNHIKGGKYVIELAKRLPNLTFVVAGPTYGRELNLPSNIKVLGAVTAPHKLAQLYSMSHLTLLTSKKETFSMVCAESLCCGTPIVGFEAGAPEQISLPDYSRFVTHGDTQALAQIARELLDTPMNKVKISQQAHQVYAKEKMAKQYIENYKRLLQ